MSLEKYNQKRDFSETKEPQGKTKKSKQSKLRFVIQCHRARAKHYDLRLEHNGVLLSWAVPKGLSFNPKDKRLAVMVEDHPIDYMNFEGVIPKGNYGAGIVEIFDKGYYIPQENMAKSIKNGNIKFSLMGKKLKGGWSLVKTDENNWLAIKANDEFATSLPQTEKSNKNPFSFAQPQLALLSEKIPTSKDWLFEIKYDGYRILAYKEKSSTKLFSRNKQDYSTKFKDITKSISNLTKDVPFVLDGEVVCFDETGRSDFGLLQHNLKQAKGGYTYVIFDILALNGNDLRNKPLTERKEILENLLINSPKNIMFSTHVLGNGRACFNMAKKHNLEGIVAKKINSPYSGTRNGDWLKIKCHFRQEFVIGGFSTTAKNKELSAILVGYYEKNRLIYVGKVGTGFSEKTKHELAKLFKRITLTNSPFKNPPKGNHTPLTPTLVAEIKFAEITKDGLLRQPSFVGLRSDKDPKQVKLEVAK